MTDRNIQHQRRLPLVLMAAALGWMLSSIALTSCRASAYNEPVPMIDYALALVDAQRPTADKVTHTLMPISDDNKALEWTTIDTMRMVLVCKFIDTKSIPIWDRTDTFRIQTKNGYWVTLPADWHRQAQQFRGLDSVAARQRMVEMLGLWPECDYTHVVLFYADVSRMFRPAFDPSIHTTTSPNAFPEWADENLVVGGDINFRQWFDYQRKNAYLGQGACPWGQLGYSYDWHHGSSHQGLSEYVVSNNTVVRVKQWQSAWSFIKGLTGR